MYPPGRPPMTTSFTPEMVKEFGIPKDDLWRYTPHPIASTSEYIRLAGRQKTIAKKTFVRTQWANPQFHQFQELYERFSKDPAWRTFRVQTGHMMMLEDPKRVAQILEDAI